jgi:hypothetical protein
MAACGTRSSKLFDQLEKFCAAHSLKRRDVWDLRLQKELVPKPANHIGSVVKPFSSFSCAIPILIESVRYIERIVRCAISIGNIHDSPAFSTSSLI